MKRWFLALGLVAAALAGAASARAGEHAGPPVVVELFTSQGCSSCPPAEAFLRELAQRDGIIALEYHIDYWDFIGWKDPFAKRVFTERQKGYVRRLGARYAYTPQMVIGGVAHAIGSRRAEIEARIAALRRARIYGPKISVRKENGDVLVEIGGAHTAEEYDILFVTFDKMRTTRVRRGENRGRTLQNVNVVRDYERVGRWTGAPVSLRIRVAGRPGDGGCAVLVQKRGYGRIIAAATLPFQG